jgi:hypothetical protein
MTKLIKHLDGFIDEASHEAKVMLFMLYYMEELIDKGLIEGPKTLSTLGKQQAERLIEQNFSVTEEEAKEAMSFLANMTPEDSQHRSTED